MKTLHEKLKDLASRLEGDDAATVWSAVMATAPVPTPTIETCEQVVPGLYHHFRFYG
jgi:hypothetical protein